MPPPASPPPPTEETLSQINESIAFLLLSCLSVKCFLGRFQVIHSKLLSLQSLLSSLSSQNWSQNPLLPSLLPTLFSSLTSLQSLSLSCNSSPSPPNKLLLQSDLDIASSSLHNTLSHLHLLLSSGVLSSSSAIVLSRPASSSKEDLSFYIRDLFTRLQIGGADFKHKSLLSLVHLLDDNRKSAFLVPSEGNIRYLIHLLDDLSLRDLALSAVSLLASAGGIPRKAVFEEGGLGPLLRVLETGSSSLKERASMAIESLTADPENSWALSAYGGVCVLLEACKCGSLTTQAHAAGAIKNAVVVEDVRLALMENNDAVAVLVQLLVSGSPAGQEKSAGVLAILAASGDVFLAAIVQERGLQRLVQLVNDSTNFETLENGLRAIQAMCSDSGSIARSLASSTLFVVRLAELVVNGNAAVQRISAAMLGSLAISDGNKRAVGATTMGQLVRLMEMPKPGGMQEAAAGALVALLTVRSNRKELARDEKSVARLVKMMDVGNEAVCKEYPVAVVAAMVGGGDGSRKRLVAAGMVGAVQRLAEMEVVGAKKVAQRLSGNRFKSIFSRTWRE